MDIFSASIHAEYVHNHLLQAHSFQGVGADSWERGQLESALKHLGKLVALESALRARLAVLNGEQAEQAEEAA